MLMTFPPNLLGFQFLPMFSVGTVPYVRPIFIWVSRPTAQYPNMVTIDRRGKPDPSVPRRLCGFLNPVNAISRTPYVVIGKMLRHIITSAENIDSIIKYDSLVVSSRCPPRMSSGL